MQTKLKVGRASLPAKLMNENSGHHLDSVPPVHGAWFEGYRRRLPHWRLEGATYFVTWRLIAGLQDLTPDERTLVANAIRFFDTQRYGVFSYVVMNDHVHVIVRPYAEHLLENITHSWKSFTANRMQRIKGRARSIWQDESFDRIIRDEDEFFEKLHYIMNNPIKRWPDLKDYQWLWVHSDFAELFPRTAGGQGRPPH